MSHESPALTGAAPPPAAGRPRWFEVVLALAVVGLLVAAAVALLVSLHATDAPPELAAADWRGGARATAFLVVMLVAGGIALAAFAVFAIRRASRPGANSANADSRGAGPAVSNGAVEASAAGVERGAAYSPAGTRLLGLGLLVVALLLLGWVYLDPAVEHAMVMRLLYPAALGVAVVLLFDKATRAWNLKSQAESVREWLLCDAAVFLLVLGFLSVSQSVAPDAYAGLFWDCLHLSLFFVALWLVDRTASRYRFLLAYVYFTLLPLLLGIWRWANGIEAPEDAAWWGSVWPFAILAALFAVLEIVALAADREGERHALVAVKDALFVVLYAVLLIIAMPAPA